MDSGQRRCAIEELRAYARERGRAATVAVWQREHRRPGASLIIRRYDPWRAALTAALPPDM